MFATLVRRITVKTLDVVVDRGRRSTRAPVRIAARALDRARTLVGLEAVRRGMDLPPWTGAQPERPMWETDRKKLRKWQTEQGIIKEDGGDQPTAAAAPVGAIEVWYKRGCPWARAAIELLRERDLPFVEHDIKSDGDKLEWLRIVTGKKTTPQIFVHGEAIGGYEELRALEASGELDKKLQRAAASREQAATAASTVHDDDEIDVADLRERLDDGAEVLLLDVRSHAEADATGMLEHAVLVPMDELSARAGELDGEAVWVAYCKAGTRSKRAVQLLREQGFRSVVGLRGGIDAWLADRGPVVRLGASTPKTKPTRVRLPVVHPERSPFEALVDEWQGENEEELDDAALVVRVREVLDECRPMVQQDGGDIELLDIVADVVHVRLTGNCIGCPSSQATLKQGIEARLKRRIPQIKGIASPQLA
ncbi:MAG TPA: NifU family protein [Nannocystaceae bacterium]|nr:NifU family protein [Nannocystaceae bacterium]